MHLSKRLAEYLGDQWILVVEPTSNYRTSIKQFLSNLKAKRVKSVASVADARREMLTAKIGLFIVEWALDEVNGLQFCRALRKEPAYRQTPFLLLSVENLRKDIILAAEVDITAYLLKPFSYEDFCSQIDGLIKRKTQPSAVSVALDTADEMVQRGELDAAQTLYDDALAQKGNSARAYCGLAKIARARGDNDKAAAYVRTAVVANPEYIECYRLMLEIAEARKDRSAMIQAASVMHQMSPENPRYTLVLARCYLEMAEHEGSEKFFRKTLSLSPRMAEAYKGLGNVYLAQEEYEKAVRSFRKALDLDTGDIATLNSLGMAYVRIGQFKEGIARYLMALKLDPHDGRVLFNIGQAYEKRGDMEKARWYYSQALIHRRGYDKAKRGVERVEKLIDGKPTSRDPLAGDDEEGDEIERDDGKGLKKSS